MVRRLGLIQGYRQCPPQQQDTSMPEEFPPWATKLSLFPRMLWKALFSMIILPAPSVSRPQVPTNR